MNEAAPKARTRSPWRHAPWLLFALWGPFVAVRFLDSHLADGSCSCTQGFERLLPVAPGYFGVVLAQQLAPGIQATWLIGGFVSLALLVVLSRVAALGTVIACFVGISALCYSICGALGLAAAFAA
jgi:hypothetical protein